MDNVKEVEVGSHYLQRIPKANVAYVTIFSMNKGANLAFGREVLNDGKLSPIHTVYNLNGKYLCGHPEEDLVALHSPDNTAKVDKPVTKKPRKGKKTAPLDSSPVEKSEPVKEEPA